MRFVIATESDAVARLPGGAVPYTLRRSPRSRGLRVVIHPARGVVVTVPPASRRGWAHPEPLIGDFLAEREAWLRRHLLSHARERAELAARGGLQDGAQIRFRGDLHRLRIEPARPGARRSSVERIGGLFEDELVIRHATRDARTTEVLLTCLPEAPGTRRDRTRDRPSCTRPRRHPGCGHRPRPAHAMGERVATGPARLFVAACPRPAGSSRNGRDPRAGTPARLRARPALLGGRRLAPTGSQGMAPLAPRPLDRVAPRAGRRLDDLRWARGSAVRHD